MRGHVPRVRGPGHVRSVPTSRRWTSAYEKAVMDSGPSLYWRLDEGPNATTCVDHSGNGHHGTFLAAGYQPGVPGLLAADSNPGWRNNGASGIHANIGGGYKPFVAGAQLTFEGIVLKDSHGTTCVFGSSLGHHALQQTGTAWVFYFGINGPAPANASLVNQVTAGIKTHWALTFDDAVGVFELWLNGVRRGRNQTGGPFRMTADTSNFIGGSYSGPSQSIIGVVDEQAVYERILDPNEIIGHAAIAFGQPTSSVTFFFDASLWSPVGPDVSRVVFPSDLTPNANVETPADATSLPVDSTLAADGVPESPAAASLDVSGDLSADGVPESPASASMAASGDLVAVGVSEAPASASFDVAAVLAAAGSSDVPAQASLVADSSLLAAALLEVPAAAVLAGAGNLLANGSVEVVAAALLDAAATLTATAQSEQAASADLAAVTALAAAAEVESPASAFLLAVAVLLANGRTDAVAALLGPSILGSTTVETDGTMAAERVGMMR